MTEKKSMFERLVHRCFEATIIFDVFRKILHQNFSTEKKVLKKELDLTKKTLDFGCGSGPYAVIFPQEVYIGMDVDERNIAFAQKRYKKKFIVEKSGSLKAIPKVKQLFAIDVFHHLPNVLVKKYVDEFYQVLEEGGKILILDHYPVKEQTKIMGKILLTFDRGKYIRDKQTLMTFFEKKFIGEKTYDFYAAGCRDYALVLRKKEK